MIAIFHQKPEKVLRISHVNDHENLQTEKGALITGDKFFNIFLAYPKNFQ